MRHTGLIVGLVIAFVILSSVACCGVGANVVFGSGRVVEKTFEVSDFSGVTLATFGDLYIEMGEEESLRVEAEKNLVEYFEVTTENGMLKIDDRDFVALHPTKPVKFYLTAKELDTIVLSGSGDIDAPDLEGKQISITISGSGDLKADDLSADEIALKISGSGSLGVEGSQAKRQGIAISGSGDVRIDDLEADDLQVRIDGSGSVRISGGDAKEQRVSVYGSGDYRARDLASEEANVTGWRPRSPAAATSATPAVPTSRGRSPGPGTWRRLGIRGLETRFLVWWRNRVSLQMAGSR
jgi:hypothetical protein